MTAIAALFSLELGRRRHYLLFGAALGLLALVLPWFGSTDPSATRAIAAGIFAFAYLLAGALLAGSALFVDDLAAGRAGFLVGRPFRTWQLLVGRLAAVLVALAGAVILTALPALAAGAEVLGDSGSLAVVFSTIAGPREALWLPAAGVIRPVALVLAVLGLVGLGNALGLMARVRGGWLLLDLTSGLVLSAALLRAADELAIPGSGALRYLVLPGTLILAGLGLAVATTAQVASGRTDGRRAHRAFSLVWFVVALALSIATVGFSRWYVTPSPFDLELRGMTAIEHSPGLLEVHGTVPRPAPLEAWFLVDRESGRVARLEVLSWRGMSDSSVQAAVVDRGRTAFWWTRDRRSRSRTLHRLDLTASEWRPVATPVEIEPDWLAGPVSPDGTVVYRARRTDSRTVELVADRVDGAGAVFTKRIETPGFRRFIWLDATARSVSILLLVEATSPWARDDEAPELSALESCRGAIGSPLEGELARSIRTVVLEVDAGPGAPLVRPIDVSVATYGDDGGVIVGGPADEPSVLLRLGKHGWARVDADSGRIESCLRLPERSDTRYLRGIPRLLPSGRVLLRSRIDSVCRWTLFDRAGEELLTVPEAGNGYDWGIVVEAGSRILHAYPSHSTFPAFDESGALAAPTCRPTESLEPGWYLRVLDPSTGRIEQEGPLPPEILLRRLFTSGYARAGGDDRPS